MPPPKSGKSLNAAQKAVLKEWIAQGASYQTHWSFLPPRRPATPKVGNAAWPRNPIDHFIVARLEAEVLLTAMARRIETIEPNGAPKRLLNNALRGLTSLPVRITG